MPRLFDRGYLFIRSYLAEVWQTKRQAFSLISTTDQWYCNQWYLHQYLRPSDELTEPELLAHRHAVTQTCRSVPAGPCATWRIPNCCRQSLVRSAWRFTRWCGRILTSAAWPGPSYRSRRSSWPGPTMAIPPWYPSPRQRPQHHAGITAEAVADLGQRPAGGVESHLRLHLVRTQALSPRVTPARRRCSATVLRLMPQRCARTRMSSPAWYC
jgi:hypothetical protein